MTEIQIDAVIYCKAGTTEAMLRSPEALQGETFAINIEATKGVFNKRVVCVYRVSNYRFFVYDYEMGHMHGPFPIQHIRAVVDNKHSTGSGFGMRTYSGMQSVGTWNRESTVIGDVSLFWIPTGERISHISMRDPTGVASIINNLREMALKSHPQSPNPTEPKANHIGTELAKLAKLLEKGELTQEEFEKAKKGVLG